MTKREIKIACKGADSLPVGSFEHFQGGLKTLDKEDFVKGVESIVKLGFSFPVCVWRNGKNRKIIDGHQRLHVIQQMLKDGWTLPGGKLPVSWVEAKDEKEAKAKVLAATSQYGRMTYEGLYEFIETAGLKINDIVALTRFPEINMERFTSGFYFDDKKGKTDPDDVPEEPRKASTKLGDVYVLGDHVLKCGDSTKSLDVNELLGGGGAIDAVFTDPPYNVNYSGQGKNTSNTIKNDNMSKAQFRQFLTKSFATMRAMTKPGAPVYVCYASRTHREFEDALNANGFEVKNQIIWVKTVASMGWGDYRWKHEPILYCHKKDEPVRFYGDRCQYTEWTEELNDDELLEHIKKLIKIEESGGSTVWRLSRDSFYEHPTQKPTQLIKIALKNSTKRGDTVLDLFGGSGSTLIACEETSRKARIVELDPIYCDVICKRWEEFTGQKAEKWNGKKKKAH